MKKVNLLIFQKPFMFLFAIWIITSSITCDKTKHEEFAVFLLGKYAATESAVVTLDGNFLGTATFDVPAHTKLAAGTHYLEIVTNNVNMTIKQTIMKTDEHDLIFNVYCDPANVYVNVNLDYALLDQTALFEHLHLGGVMLTPGEETKVAEVNPSTGNFFNFIDKNGKSRYVINKSLIYKEEWHTSVPYVK